MPDLITNIVEQVKNRQLSKSEAIEKLRQCNAEDKVTEHSLIMYPSWHPKNMDSVEVASQWQAHWIILCEPPAIWQSLSAKVSGKAHYLTLQSEQREIDQRYQDYALELLKHLQAMLHHRPKSPVLIQFVVPFTTAINGSKQKHSDEKQLFTGLFGMLKTLRQENPRLIGQLIEISAQTDVDTVISQLMENRQAFNDEHIRYNNSQRSILQWQEMGAVTMDVEAGTTPCWRDEGAYLITGGAGGLGLIFANEIAQTVKNPKLFLTGRSVLNSDKQAQLKALEDVGATVSYHQVDVTDSIGVQQLIDKIVKDFGQLNGILHTAGLSLAHFLVKKTAGEFKQVLAPKVTGLVNLDQASKALKLDFILLFSSMSSVLGTASQADYAAANAFMDAYTHYRNDLVAEGKRHGRTVSINWPLWKHGGIQISAQAEEVLKQTSGLMPMQTELGLAAFYQVYANNHITAQTLVVQGDIARFKKTLLAAEELPPPTAVLQNNPVEESTAQIDKSALRNKIHTILNSVVSKLIKIEPGKIDIDETFSAYGFESVTLVRFAKEINQQYSLDLSTPIFYEFSTVSELAEHLLDEHADAFMVGENKTKTPSTVDKPPQANPQPAPNRAAIGHAATPTLTPKQQNEPIAIVGISGCFPKAKNVDELWQNLLAGKDCIDEIPKSRWDWRAIYGDPKGPGNKCNIKWLGSIDNADKFDPRFFNISPNEANFMDPQHRLLMTHVWNAIEDAGYSARSLAGSKTGVFLGITENGYNKRVMNPDMEITSYSGICTAPSIAPARISYFFDFHGPSNSIDTACSSSLVAIHRSINAIKAGDCELALAGGVNILLKPEDFIGLNQAGALAEDGRCKTFSNQANGYVRSEGVGIVMLKTLPAAQCDGDHIYGVIRGSAENHGGRSNSLTAPNPKAQAAVIKTAYTHSGLDPRTIGYIEAHGTGTILGDPVEINGLKSAFKDLYKAMDSSPLAKNDGTRCGLGSIKTNIGHLETAAGVTGVIKVLLQLKHKTLFKSLHCETLNKDIHLDNSPFYIVKENEPWQVIQDAQGNDLPRRAGVSSFGVGGSNAHVIIEEYRNPGESLAPVNANDGELFIIVLSAKETSRLQAQAQHLIAAIEQGELTDADLPNMAYTLQIGRNAMAERLAVCVTSLQLLKQRLQAFLDGDNDIENLYIGNIKHDKHLIAELSNDENMNLVVNGWIQTKKYQKLLTFWCKGLDVDWTLLHQAKANQNGWQPQRISLPTYPFVENAYWLDDVFIQTPTETKQETFEQPQSTPYGSDEPQHTTDRNSTADIDVKTWITELMAGEMLIPVVEIDVDEHFMELGADSLVLMKAMQKVEQQFAITITNRQLYRELSTITLLANHIQQHYGNIPSSDHQAGLSTLTTKAATEAETTAEPAEKKDPTMPSDVKQWITELFADEMLVPIGEIDDDEHFMELGADSIVLMKIMQKVEQQFDVTISNRQLYQSLSTIALLSDYIKNQHSDSLKDRDTAEHTPADDNVSELTKTPIQTNIKAWIKQLFSDEMLIPQEEIDDDEHFMEIGADSIVLMKIMQQVEEQFSITITNRQLYEKLSTITLLAEYLQTLPNKMYTEDHEPLTDVI
jgi:bacillaene biosynthesis, polyketide synthase / nonribosomal peptide synthetase PksN/BaeN